MAERYTPSQLDCIERMLDKALCDVEIYKAAWKAERDLKWTLAYLTLSNYYEHNPQAKANNERRVQGQSRP